MNEVIIYLISAIVGLWLGSVEWRLRNMEQRLRNSPDRHEVNRQIDIKQEATTAVQQELKEDMKEVKQKLDRLIEMNLPKNK